MNTAAATLVQVVADLDRLLGDGSLETLPDAERLAVLQAAGAVQRRVDAVIVETLAGSDDASAFASRAGCRSANELLRRALLTDSADAARYAKGARLVHRDRELTTGSPLPGRWPALHRALHDGAIGLAGLLAATGPIERAGPRVSPADRWAADALLAAQARGVIDDGSDQGRAAPAPTPDELRVRAQVIVAYLDPDGAEPDFDRAARSRGVRLGAARDGLVPITGRLLPEAAGQLQRLWDAYLNPKSEAPPLPAVRFAPSEDDPDYLTCAADLAERMPIGLADTRSRPQLQHDALMAILGTAARHHETPTIGGAAPTLVVSVTAEDYAAGRGRAQVDAIDSPAPVALARHTACAGTVQRVISDPDGRIIGIESSDRIFTAQQRRAIALRDGGCLIPGCDVPASWCEIHHVREHARGGPTSTDNGVALCWHHHRTLDTSGWAIRMHHGVPHVRGPGWWDPGGRWWNPRTLRPLADQATRHTA